VGGATAPVSYATSVTDCPHGLRVKFRKKV